MSHSPGQLFGPYQLHRSLHDGGLSRVYEAEHPQHGVVALKVFDPTRATIEHARERFVEHAALLRHVAHPNVVRMHEDGTVGDRPYVAMELVPGEPVDAILRRQQRFSVPAAVEVLRQLLKGLECVHERGIVHRDLKPSNLVLDTSGSQRRIVLIDFGIALAGTPGVVRRTGSGTIIGTPHYLAPERILGSKKVDARVDVYAAGVILYELLAGCAPFENMPMGKLLAAAATLDAPDVREWMPNVPEGVAAVVGCALRRDPSSRFPSACTFRRALESAMAVARIPLGAHLLRGLPVEPRVPNPVELRPSRAPKQRAGRTSFVGTPGSGSYPRRGSMPATASATASVARLQPVLSNTREPPSPAGTGRQRASGVSQPLRSSSWSGASPLSSTSWSGVSQPLRSSSWSGASAAASSSVALDLQGEQEEPQVDSGEHLVAISPVLRDDAAIREGAAVQDDAAVRDDAASEDLDPWGLASSERGEVSVWDFEVAGDSHEETLEPPPKPPFWRRRPAVVHEADDPVVLPLNDRARLTRFLLRAAVLAGGVWAAEHWLHASERLVRWLS